MGPRVLSTGAPAALPTQQDAGASFMHPSHAAAAANQTGRDREKAFGRSVVPPKLIFTAISHGSSSKIELGKP
jgi:hypothetical protein